MARFDPWMYPDRLSFEAYARRIRTEELGKTFDAIAAWLESRRRKSARVNRPALSLGLPSNHHVDFIEVLHEPVIVPA